MTIFDQICPLEPAFELKDQGLEQNSLFFWNKQKSGPHKEEPSYGYTSNAICSAYTVSELGKFMPLGETFEYKGKQCFIVCIKSGDQFYCCIRVHDKDQADMIQGIGRTETLARARLMLICLEEKIPEFSIINMNNRYKEPGFYDKH